MNSEQDEITAVEDASSAPKDFESADRDAAGAYHDHQDRQDAQDWAETSKAYVNADQEAADGLMRHFGLPDSEEVRKRAQEAREAQGASEGRKRVEIQLGWGVSEEGEPSVRILQGAVPPNLTVDDAEVLIAQLTDVTNGARRMAEMWKWLTENGVDGDLRKQLVMDAYKRTSEEAAKTALLGLGFGGMFRNWG